MSYLINVYRCSHLDSKMSDLDAVFGIKTRVKQLQRVVYWSHKHQSHIGCDHDATCSRPISLQLTGGRWGRSAHIWNEFVIAD